MTRQEYLDSLGLNSEQAEAKSTTLTMGRSSNGKRHLMETAKTVDHFADGYMHKVKDQGQCGSCWAFGANTTLEGTIAKKTNSAPVRISEQELVDCSYSSAANIEEFDKDYDNWGCMGGWMSSAWDFQIDNGFMLDSDYPYFSGDTGSHGDCKHKKDKINGKTHSYGQITTTVSDMKAKAMFQPLSVALDASSSTFQFYSSGVVKQGDGCGDWLNHAVVIVGYTDEDEENDDNDDNDNDEEEEEEEQDDEEEEEEDDGGSINILMKVH